MRERKKRRNPSLRTGSSRVSAPSEKRGGKIRIRLLAAFGTSEWGKEANLQFREIRHPIEKSLAISKTSGARAANSPKSKTLQMPRSCIFSRLCPPPKKKVPIFTWGKNPGKVSSAILGIGIFGSGWLSISMLGGIHTLNRAI